MFKYRSAPRRTECFFFLVFLKGSAPWGYLLDFLLYFEYARYWERCMWEEKQGEREKRDLHLFLSIFIVDFLMWCGSVIFFPIFLFFTSSLVSFIFPLLLFSCLFHHCGVYSSPTPLTSIVLLIFKFGMNQTESIILVWFPSFLGLTINWFLFQIIAYFFRNIFHTVTLILYFILFPLSSNFGIICFISLAGFVHIDWKRK